MKTIKKIIKFFNKSLLICSYNRTIFELGRLGYHKEKNKLIREMNKIKKIT